MKSSAMRRSAGAKTMGPYQGINTFPHVRFYRGFFLESSLRGNAARGGRGYTAGGRDGRGGEADA